MKFDQLAGQTLVDGMRQIGRPVDRADAKLKVTGRATYAHDQRDVPGKVAYGYVVGARVGKGQIRSIDLRDAQAASGVLAIVTHENAGPLGVGAFYVQRPLAGPEIDHYHQAVALVVAETFEEARAAAQLIHVDYIRMSGAFDLTALQHSAPVAKQGMYGGPTQTRLGDPVAAFGVAEFTVDQTYIVPDQAHAMIEPHATIAAWDGDQLTCWTAIQLISWARRDLGRILSIPSGRIRLVAPFIGGGFGGKGAVQCDLVLAAPGARVAGRPVKIALPRPLMFNNTIHRPKTIQRIRLAACQNGKLTAISRETLSGNLRRASLL